jgi:hypothetical protein
VNLDRIRRQDIYKELVVRHNEPMLSGEEVVRLIGYAEDHNDCYLIMHSPTRGVYWHTAVGGYMFLTMLKGQGCIRGATGEDWNDLWRLDQGLILRGVPRRDEFEVSTVEMVA